MSKQRQGLLGRRANARVQVVLCAVIGCCAFGVAVALGPWQAAVAIGWDVTAAAWIGWTASHVLPMGPDETRELATLEDSSRAARDAMLVGASQASLVSVVLVLLKAANEKGAAQDLLTALGPPPSYCHGRRSISSSPCDTRGFTTRAAGGMDFHDHRLPDYGDFTYVAFTIGMTYQVSDTDLTGKGIRMTAAPGLALVPVRHRRGRGHDQRRCRASE
jgi:uncharacterized membrane protein